MSTYLGNMAARSIFHEENYAIVMGFPCTDDTVVAGQQVVLGTDGSVTRVTAATQRPLGPVVSSFKGNDKGQVRVLTPFSMCLDNQNAAAAINAGVPLAATGVTAGNVTTYATAAAGQMVSAVSLSVSTGANTPIAVGILRVPYQLPA